MSGFVRFCQRGFEDDRVRHEVVCDLYKNRLMTVIVSIVASVLFYRLYDFVRESLWLSGVLLAWVAVGLWQFGLAHQIRRRSPDGRTGLTAVDTQRYVIFSVVSSVTQAVSLSSIALSTLQHESALTCSPI